MNKRTALLLRLCERALGRYVVRIEPVPGEPELTGIGVYGVEDASVAQVLDVLSSIEQTTFSSAEGGIVPLLRSKEVTEKYYPDLARAWGAPTELQCLMDLTVASHRMRVDEIRSDDKIR